MAATARNPSKSFESIALKPPLHPTYDLKGIIKLALAEDAGGQGYLVLFRFSPIPPSHQFQ
jgi:nicotinate-nucleotide pyrophosphorylase (carboxylating)